MQQDHKFSFWNICTKFSIVGRRVAQRGEHLTVYSSKRKKLKKKKIKVH